MVKRIYASGDCKVDISQYKDIVDGYSIVKAKFFTTAINVAVIKDNIEDYTVNLEWDELRPLGKGMLQFVLFYSNDDSAFDDGSYDQTDVKTTDFYIVSDITVEDNTATDVDVVMAEEIQENLNEVNAKVANVYTKDETYSKDEVDDLIEEGGGFIPQNYYDKNDINTIVSGINEDFENYYDKENIDTIVSGISDDIITYTDNPTINKFIKTLYIDTSDYNGELDVSELYIRYYNNYIYIYNSATSSGVILLNFNLATHQSVYCYRSPNGIYVYIEVNTDLIPSQEVPKTKLNEWTYKIDPRLSFEGTTESPILNKYVKKIWFEFDDETQRESWVGKVHLYNISNLLVNDRYTQVMMIRHDYANTNIIYYSQTSGKQLVTRKVSGMTINLLVDWEALKDKNIASNYTLVSNQCFMKDLNKVELSDTVGDSSNIAFSQKGAQTLSGEIESNSLAIGKINYHPNYTNNAVMNKLIKKMYVDVTNYKGDDIVFNESGVPNIKVYVSSNVLEFYMGSGTSDYIMKINFVDGQTEYSNGGWDKNNNITGVFCYIEIDPDFIPTTAQYNQRLTAEAFNKENDPRFNGKLKYIDNITIDKAIRALYVNTDSYNGGGTIDDSLHIRYIINGGSQGVNFGIGLYGNDFPNVVELSSQIKSAKGISSRGIFAYMDIDWDALKNYNGLIYFYQLLPKALEKPNFLDEDAIHKAFDNASSLMVRSDKSNGISYADRKVSNVVYEGCWKKAFQELATRTNGDECNGIPLTTEDIEVPTPIEGEGVYNYVVSSQTQFYDLNSIVNRALSSATSANTDVNIFIESGVYYAKGRGAWISGDSYVEIVNQETSLPQIRVLNNYDNYINKNLRIIGNGDVKIVVGDKHFGSVSENKIDCGEYWKVPHVDDSGNTIPYNYRYTYFDENLNNIDILNVNKVQEALSEITKDTELSSQLGKKVYCITIPKGSCPIIPLNNTYDMWLFVTSAWKNNYGQIFKTEEDSDGNVIVWFECNIEESDINMDAGYGGGNPRFKLLNEKPRHDSVLIRDGYIYVPKKFGFVTECRYDHFMSITSTNFNKVEIKGLHIMGGAQNTSGDGYQSGLFRIAAASNVRIENCKFTNIGTKVIRTWSTASNVEFMNNYVENANVGAITTGLQGNGIRIVGNTFKNIGRAPFASSVMDFQSKNTYVGYNTILDYNYIAIDVGTWVNTNTSYDETNTATAIIECNEMYYTEQYAHDRMNKVMMDGGSIYCRPRNKGVVVRYNYIHDVKGWRDRYAGIYLDGGSHNVSIYGNLVTNVGTNGLYINFWPNVYTTFPTCNLNNACVGNITDKSIWFKGNPHTEVLTDEWKQSICGANILLQGDYKGNVESSDTVKEITVDDVVYQLPNVHAKMDKMINGEPYVNEELFFAMRDLPIPEFIKQRFHKAISTKATDEGGKKISY